MCINTAIMHMSLLNSAFSQNRAFSDALCVVLDACAEILTN